MVKGCFKCQEVKPLSEFYPHKRMADGHLNKCKACAREDMRKHREAGLCQESDWRRYHENEQRRQMINEKAADFHRSNPLIRKAHSAISNAIRDGRLTRPTQCSQCGSEGKRIEAHHDDYSKPLEVRWLCKRCHALANLVNR